MHAPCQEIDRARSILGSARQSPDVLCTHMVREPPTKRFDLRLAPSELAAIKALSTETGLSMSDVVRQAIRRAWFERHGERPLPKK